MSTFRLLETLDWDEPFFKRLARNDTGQAVGHQGGMVLPKPLRDFLPTLDVTATTRQSPTVDRHIRVEMFDGANFVAEGDVRYQFQTWGGTRSAESRLTDGLHPLRDRAAEGDIMIIQRRGDTLNRFRFVLVKRGTPEFVQLSQLISDRRWGPLDEDNPPVTQLLLSQTQNEIADLVKHPFELMRPQVTRVEARQSHLARSSVFRERVRQEYDSKCAVSRIDLSTPTMLKEIECAHVVPLERGGTDDIRNGITLTRTLHWAFDRGLFGVLPERVIYIPRLVMQMPENSFLGQFENKPITEASNEALRVHADAFQWHLQTLVSQWE
jgi:putative restriction endonuclease